MKRIILISVLIVFGSLTSFPGPVENPESDIHGSDTLGTIRADSTSGVIEGDELVLYLEEVQEKMSLTSFFNAEKAVVVSNHQLSSKLLTVFFAVDSKHRTNHFLQPLKSR